MTPFAKGLIIALAISGALNFLCAGLFIGGAIHRSRMRAERGGMPPAALSERREGRRRPGPFGGVLAGHRDEMVARRHAVVDARKAVQTALEQEPFEPAALE